MYVVVCFVFSGAFHPFDFIGKTLQALENVVLCS